MAKKAPTIFDWIKDIIQTKSSWDSHSDEAKKVFNPFMIHKFLSQNKDYIELVNYISGLNILDKEKLYKIYVEFIPKSSKTYHPFIKATASKKFQDELLSLLSTYFETSKSEVIDYLEILKVDDIKEILDKMGISEKEQKILLK